MARVCVDACFLIGLSDKDDQHHWSAVRHFDALFGEESGRHQFVAPWPILYECLGTRWARDPRKLVRLRQRWNYLSGSGQFVLLDDELYRGLSLDELLEGPRRALSLIDRVLRAMILDHERSFDFFLTYNTGDFVDACEFRGITLIIEASSPESYGI